MVVTYGCKIQKHDDPFLSRAQELLDIFIQVSPEKGALLTAFPISECRNSAHFRRSYPRQLNISLPGYLECIGRKLPPRLDY